VVSVLPQFFEKGIPGKIRMNSGDVLFSAWTSVTPVIPVIPVIPVKFRTAPAPQKNNIKLFKLLAKIACLSQAPYYKMKCNS